SVCSSCRPAQPGHLTPPPRRSRRPRSRSDRSRGSRPCRRHTGRGEQLSSRAILYRRAIVGRALLECIADERGTGAVNDYAELDATALAERVRRKEVSARELVEHAITAIEQVDPRLHAVVHRMYDRARETASAPLPEGPFTGVPFVVKDLDGFVADEPYTA